MGALVTLKRPEVSSPGGLTLFRGVEASICAALGIESYRHIGATDKLCRIPPPARECAELVSGLFALVAANWSRCIASAGRQPSRQNWRWHDPKLHLAPHNKSPEVSLERALIQACDAIGRRDWSNQVPVASGLLGTMDSRRRAIDLVYQRDERAFDFIELKVGSDNPLYAAIEIALYGFLWLLSRRDRVTLGYADKVLINARSVRLSVLAPRSFYRGNDWSWLSRGVGDGLRSIGAHEQGVGLHFALEELSSDFRWPANYDGPTLVQYFDQRRAR